MRRLSTIKEYYSLKADNKMINCQTTMEFKNILIIFAKYEWHRFQLEEKIM